MPRSSPAHRPVRSTFFASNAFATLSHLAAIAGVGLGVGLDVADGAGLADPVAALDGSAVLGAGEAEAPQAASTSTQQASRMVRRMECIGLLLQGRDGFGTEAEPGHFARSALFYTTDV